MPCYETVEQQVGLLPGDGDLVHVHKRRVEELVHQHVDGNPVVRMGSEGVNKQCVCVRDKTKRMERLEGHRRKQQGVNKPRMCE